MTRDNLKHYLRMSEKYRKWCENAFKTTGDVFYKGAIVATECADQNVKYIFVCERIAKDVVK